MEGTTTGFANAERQLASRSGGYLTSEIPGTLMLMRWRTGLAWTLVGSVGLLFLLVLTAHPIVNFGAQTGMSAPSSFPAASLEATRAPLLLQPQFNGHGDVLCAIGCFPALGAIRARIDARRDTGTAPPHYGPVNSRPPPSFS
jgi:hypothetical protein